MKVALLILPAIPIAINAQSFKEIADEEQYCGLAQIGAGHTLGTKSFIEYANHYIGPMMIKKGIMKRYIGNNFSPNNQKRKRNNLSLKDQYLFADC